MSEQQTQAPIGIKPKKKRGPHRHIGPNIRAYSVGRALCPVCDAEKISRITERDREIEKAAKESMRRISSR